MTREVARLAVRLREAALAKVQRRLDRAWAAGGTDDLREDDENLRNGSRLRRVLTPHFNPISSVKS